MAAALARKISAYVPCYNDAATLPGALASLSAQTFPPDEIIVVDDGSSDDSRAIAERCGARVVALTAQRGRGAARARAMLEAQHEMVLCCDARRALAKDYVERGIAWFDDERVGAAFGLSIPPDARGAVDRWRDRHLLRTQVPVGVSHGAPLETGGTMVRRSAVLGVGNYDARLRHSEDSDLGSRLIAAGYDVVRDPALKSFITVRHGLLEVLERYWRWNAGTGETITLGVYARRTWYAMKVMLREDAAARDYGAMPITLLAPHYELWLGMRTRWRRRHAQ